MPLLCARPAYPSGLASLAALAQCAPLYPLTSKSKLFKPFRTQLIQLIHSLLAHMATTPLLYITTAGAPPPSGPSTPLVHVLLAWLHPMTSSGYRPIRHTATLVVLAIGTALCGVVQSVQRELAGADKQKEAEARKPAGKARERRVAEIEARIEESMRKKAVVEDYLKDIFDGWVEGVSCCVSRRGLMGPAPARSVFVHRYRDSNALIRTDCLRQLGQFMEKYPDKFVATKYLHYVDWALCDSVGARQTLKAARHLTLPISPSPQDKDARTEAVKMLVPIYRKNTHISHIRAFTARATVRLMEMAARDIDTAIRVYAVHVLSAMDRIGLLADMARDEDDRRDRMGWLVYDREVKVRRAVAGFVKGLWADEVEVIKEQAMDRQGGGRQRGRKGRAGKGKKQANGRAAHDDADASDLDEPMAGSETAEEQYMGLKALVTMLCRYSKGFAEVDANKQGETPADGEESQDVRARQSRELLLSMRTASLAQQNHAWVAVDALWAELPLLQDWQVLIKYLSLDHTSKDVQDQAWGLEESEETFAIEILLSVLRKIDDLIKGKKVGLVSGDKRSQTPG